MARQRIRKKPMAQINVVPYIDVTLVLLLIFMITTPIIKQGVKVELPQASAKALPPTKITPLVIRINAQGQLFVNVGEHQKQPVDDNALMVRVAAVLRSRPGTPVMVGGDQGVPYGRVVHTMALLQAAGAPSVGLMTQSPAKAGK